MSLNKKRPINLKLQHPPGQPTGILLLSVSRGGEFEPCLARVGSLNQKGYVFGIQVFYLLTWRCLEVVFTFLSIGSEEMVYKVWILKLGHCSWVGHLIPIFAQIFDEISHRGVCWSFELIDTSLVTKFACLELNQTHLFMQKKNHHDELKGGRKKNLISSERVYSIFPCICSVIDHRSHRSHRSDRSDRSQITQITFLVKQNCDVFCDLLLNWPIPTWYFCVLHNKEKSC